LRRQELTALAQHPYLDSRGSLWWGEDDRERGEEENGGLHLIAPCKNPLRSLAAHVKGGVPRS